VILEEVISKIGEKTIDYTDTTVIVREIREMKVYIEANPLVYGYFYSSGSIHLCDMRFFAYIHRLGKRLDLIEAADDMFKISPVAEKLSSKAVKHLSKKYWVAVLNRLILNVNRG